MATAAMIARPIPPHFNVGTSQVGMTPPRMLQARSGLPSSRPTQACSRLAPQAAFELSRSASLSLRVATSAGKGTTSACATCGRRGRNRSRNTSTSERAGLEFVRAGFELVRAYRSYSDRRHMAPSSSGMPDSVGTIIARNVLQGNAQQRLRDAGFDGLLQQIGAAL